MVDNPDDFGVDEFDEQGEVWDADHDGIVDGEEPRLSPATRSAIACSVFTLVVVVLFVLWVLFA